MAALGCEGSLSSKCAQVPSAEIQTEVFLVPKRHASCLLCTAPLSPNEGWQWRDGTRPPLLFWQDTVEGGGGRRRPRRAGFLPQLGARAGGPVSTATRTAPRLG